LVTAGLLPAYAQKKSESITTPSEGVTQASNWALGSWTGKLWIGVVPHTAYLNVLGNSKGITCHIWWVGPYSGRGATSTNCQVTAGQIKFEEGVVEIDLVRKTPNSMEGTEKTPGTARMPVALVRD
jgi:hypothetical protein